MRPEAGSTLALESPPEQWSFLRVALTVNLFPACVVPPVDSLLRIADGQIRALHHAVHLVEQTWMSMIL